jgi:hypothetical protein
LSQFKGLTAGGEEKELYSHNKNEVLAQEARVVYFNSYIKYLSNYSSSALRQFPIKRSMLPLTA